MLPSTSVLQEWNEWPTVRCEQQHFLLVLHPSAPYVQDFIQRLKAGEYDGVASMQRALGAIQSHTLADASEKGTHLVAELVPTLYHPPMCRPASPS